MSDAMKIGDMVLVTGYVEFDYGPGNKRTIYQTGTENPPVTGVYLGWTTRQEGTLYTDHDAYGTRWLTDITARRCLVIQPDSKGRWRKPIVSLPEYVDCRQGDDNE